MNRIDAIAVMKEQLERLEAMPAEYDDILRVNPALSIFTGTGDALLPAEHPATQAALQAMGCEDRYEITDPSEGDPYTIAFRTAQSQRVASVFHRPAPPSPRDLVESL